MKTMRTGAVLVIALTIFGLRGLLARAPGPPVPPRATSRPAPGQPLSGALLFGGRLDLNRATEDDLGALPGIGAERARRIIRRRMLVGPYRTIDELAEVPGIGPRTIERLRPLVSSGE